MARKQAVVCYGAEIAYLSAVCGCRLHARAGGLSVQLCLCCCWLTLLGMQGSAACKRDVLCRKLCLFHCPSLASSRTLSCDTVTWWSQSSTAKGKTVRSWDACMDIDKLICCEALLPCARASLLSEVQLGCCALHLLAQSQRDIVLVCAGSGCLQAVYGSCAT